MQHTMKLYSSNFIELENGYKKREYRLNDEKRKLIEVGDTIKFLKLPTLDKEIIKEVIKTEIFSSWEECYKKYYDADFKEIYKTIQDVVDDTYNGGYYTKEKTKKYGCKVITLKNKI